jgi:hypothetical protein
MLILLATSAQAQGFRYQHAVVVGASVVVRLDDVASGRIGASLDASWQAQGYVQRSGRFHHDFVVWADEGPAPSFGPVAHVGRCGGAWFSSVGARLGVEWPRVGLLEGWWPGPALAVELAPVIATDGLVGLDLVGVAEAPWVQGRLGAALNPGGLHAPRIAAGPSIPLVQPQNWPDVPSYWEAPTSR